MVVAIAGAHGKIALRLISLLAADGHQVIGLMRNPDHRADVEARGASAVVCDLEQASVEALAAAISGADAAVFAAGAGPGSGAARKVTVDRDAAIKLLDAAAEAGARRYVIVSAVGAESPPAGDEVFEVYLRAKAEADRAVIASDREWTVVRPGGLTDDPGTGRVRLESEPFRAQVTRDDVAAVLARLLPDPRASRHVLYLGGGDTPIEQAVERAIDAVG